MELIPAKWIRAWANVGGAKAPRTVSTVCPHCGERGNFATEAHYNDQPRATVSATARCPGCNKVVHFWAVRQAHSPKEPEENPSVYTYPPAKDRYVVSDLPSDVPEALQRAFASTADSLNSRNYLATAVGARRSLEGIFKHRLPNTDEREPLAALIERALKELDLAAPLKSLSHAIREGGNLGAHFDPDREPGAAVARQMVELLGYLISYLYVLPSQIKALEESLGKDPQPTGTAADRAEP